MWMRRGLCGLIDIRSQTMAVALMYTGLAFIGMIYGFVMIQSPDKVFNGSHAVEKVIETEIEGVGDEVLDDPVLAQNITKELAEGNISPEDQKHYEQGLFALQRQGIKVVVSSLVSMIVSIILYVGAKQNKSVYFIPWITEQMIVVSVGSIEGAILAMGGFHTVSAGQGILIFLLFVINCFLIYSVLSHFFLLRKMKQHSKEIINSVMNGNGYQTTNYDRMTEELGREMAVVPPGRSRAAQAEEDKPDRDDIMYFSI